MRRLAALALVTALVVSVAACGGSDERPPAPNTTTIETGGVEVNAIVRPPSRPGPGEPSGTTVTVLFLHGRSYDSFIWEDIELLDAVSAAGWRSVAVDLPGYGKTDDRPDEGGDAISDGAWLRGLIDDIGGAGTVVVVSPSMSGAYSLSYLEEFPEEQLLGFVPVAPVGIDDFERPKDAAPITTRAIWGSEDPSYTTARAKHLLTEMRAPGLTTTEVIEGAGHACYEDDPDAFTDLLIGFLATLDPQAL